MSELYQRIQETGRIETVEELIESIVGCPERITHLTLGANQDGSPRVSLAVLSINNPAPQQEEQ